MQLLPYGMQELLRMAGIRRPLNMKHPEKTPLQQQTTESQVSGSGQSKTGSRKQVIAAAHSSSVCRLQQRAGLKGSFANSTNA